MAGVIRSWRGDFNQKIGYWGSHRRSIRNNGNLCLMIYRSYNRNHMHTNWWNCNNGAAQGWYLDRRGVHWPNQPLRDGVKFQIKNTGNRRMALHWKEHIGGHQFRLRIWHNNAGDNRQWFVFDRRTRSIRAWSDRRKAISNQYGHHFHRGRAAVIAPWRNRPNQKTAFYGGSRRNIRNAANMCLDVWGGRYNNNNMHTTWWTCHNGLNQAWWLDQKGE
jgi:hypothetical protein